MNLSAEYTTALVRGLVSALILAGAQFFIVFAVGDAKVALISAGATFFGTLGARLGIEGTLDSRRASAPTP